MTNEIDCSKVTRVEVIDDTGRRHVQYLTDSQYVVLGFQDNNRTLKVFINQESNNGNI